MKNLLFLLAVGSAGVATFTGSTLAQQAPAQPTAEELLKGLDSNLQFETRSAMVTMTVNDGKRERVMTMQTYGRGENESAMEYLSPEREKGTKMLKIDDQLWLYLPRAERVQKISGHMMRQGMMGSDVSYEDMMAGAEFEEMYTAKVVGSEQLDGRLHWKVEAVAKDTSVTYPKRMMWIDDEYRIPSKQELYALSGMLLKTWTMGDVQEVGGQMTPMRTEITDALRPGSSTLIVTSELKYGIELEDEIFSKRWLER